MIGDFVFPSDVTDCSKLSHVKSIEHIYVLSVRGPCFTAVQKGGDDSSLINLNFSGKAYIVGIP